MVRSVSVEAEAILAVDEAVTSLLAQGLDVVRDPEIAGCFVEQVTRRLANRQKLPFSVILQEAVKAVLASEMAHAERAQIENVQI